MRIFKLDNEKVLQAALPIHHLYFVELWYSLTHQKSLDSYRVKCLNSRTLLRELTEELKISRIKPSELKGLCSEVHEVLLADPIIQSHYALFVSRILPYLESPPQCVEDEKAKKLPAHKDKENSFEFLAMDFSQELESGYFKNLCDSLISSIELGKRDHLKAIVNSILSDLIDRGWLIETLFLWYNHLLSAKNLLKYGFIKNVAFMIKMLNYEFDDFEVTLRLEGSDKLADVNSYGNFQFVKEPENISAFAPKKFYKPNEFVCYAQTQIKGTDFLAAAINAKESFDQFADLFRFDFEPSALKVDPHCYVKRLSDDKVEFPIVRSIIPNPNEDMNHSEFKAFIGDLKAVSEKNGIEESAKRKLRGALRQYRFGRDNDNFKDKFLNWWMGLETLCYSSNSEGIGETVTRNVSNIIALSYLDKLITDALVTLKYVNINLPTNLKDLCEGKNLEELQVADLIRIIHSDKSNLEALLKECENSPVLHFRCSELFHTLTNAKNTADKIDGHMNHLRWQLSRLYRIRCCIVHGSNVRFRLSLFVATLEFYLKQVTVYVLNIYKKYDHIKSLDEVYARARISYDRIISDLRAEGADHKAIQQAIYANIISSANS